MIYLDSAATTMQKPPQVAAAIRNAMQGAASPARGGYAPSITADEILFEVRRTAKELFGLPDESCAIFTKNATEALNIAIKGYTRPGDEVVISCLEHNAVVRPLESSGRRWRWAQFPAEQPEYAVDAFAKSIGRNTRLVVCTLVSNVFGTVLPCREIGELCRRRGIPFVIDASQGAGCLKIDVQELHADAVCLSGHKGLYGPQGTGLLLLSGSRLPRSLIEGGTGTASAVYRQPEELPERLESGTPNVPGIAGLGAGLKFVQSVTPEAILAHERDLIQRLMHHLGDHYLYPGRGDALNHTGVLALQPRRGSCEAVTDRLFDQDICVREGLCCAPLAHRSQGTFARGIIRVSPSYFNTEQEIDLAADALLQAQDDI